MRKLMAWVYTGDIGKTSNLYLEEVKTAASVLQLDLKVKDSAAGVDTPKSIQKSSKGKKAPAASPAPEDSTPVTKGRRSTGGSSKKPVKDDEEVVIEKQVSPEPEKKAAKSKKSKKQVVEEAE